MKIKCVELSSFERDLILKFAQQPKDAPVPPGLTRSICRRVEGKSVFTRSKVRIYQRTTKLVPAISDK